MWRFTLLSSYMQPVGGLLKPKHVHAAGFYTGKIEVVFGRYSDWLYCLVTQQGESPWYSKLFFLSCDTTGWVTLIFQTFFVLWHNRVSHLDIPNFFIVLWHNRVSHLDIPNFFIVLWHNRVSHLDIPNFCIVLWHNRVSHLDIPKFFIALWHNRVSRLDIPNFCIILWHNRVSHLDIPNFFYCLVTQQGELPSVIYF